MMGEISPTVKPLVGEISRIPLVADSCDISPMPTEIERIRTLLKTEMEAKGFSRRSLSKAADLSETAVRDLLTRTDNPGISTLRSVAEALELPFDRLTGELAQVPVLGKIGAGGEVMFHVEPSDELSQVDVVYVPRPPLTVGKLMALEIVGSSMLPKYEDGEIVYVRRDHDGILPDYLGRYCAVRTGDGGTFLKILAAGSEPNRYTLRSLNAPDMENVEVVWASPVLFVMPKQPKTAT
jgi:repressor LexA